MVDPEDLVYHGSARPTFFGSFRNTFSWKGLSISANIAYKLGYYFKGSTISYTALFNNWNGHKDFNRRWKEPGDENSTQIPSRSEEHTSELQSLMRISYAVFCLKKKNTHINKQDTTKKH